MESLARIHKHELEPEPQEEPEVLVGANDNEVMRPAPATHPEAANDNEVTQPISTLYPEAANDNAPVLTAEDAAQVEVLRERLNQFAIKPETLVSNQEEGPQPANPEEAPSTPETAPNQPEGNEPEQNRPEPAVAAAGASRRRGSGNVSGTGTPGGDTAGGSSSLLGKLWKLPWAVIKFAFKALVLLPLAIGTMIVKKLSGEAINRGGFPDGGKKKG